MDAKDVDDKLSMLLLSKDEAAALSIVLLDCVCHKQEGKNKGSPVVNYKKASVVRAEWKRRRVWDGLPTARARAAYRWLVKENVTYRKFIERHDEKLQEAAGKADYPFYIPTAELLLRSAGIEVAARPVLYPRRAYGDSDIRERLGGYRIKEAQRPQPKASYLRKCLSPCAAYHQDLMLIFLLYDIGTARQIMGTIALAEQRKLTPDVLMDNKSSSESYWRHEQDILCDVVRGMAERCEDQAKEPELYAYNHDSLHPGRSLAFPNLFITIAPGEWSFLLHNPLFQRFKCARDGGVKRLTDITGPLALHIYNVLMSVMKQLFQERNNEFWERVYEFVIRVEFQGRGTLHLHIAAWAILKLGIDIVGTSDKGHNSRLIYLLESLGFKTVNVQVGAGGLNYINGYTSKAHDSLDFRPKDWASGGPSTRWKMTYRLLCKASPCVPEIFTDMGGLAMMQRSFIKEVLYAPIPGWRRCVCCWCGCCC